LSRVPFGEIGSRENARGTRLLTKALVRAHLIQVDHEDIGLPYSSSVVIGREQQLPDIAGVPRETAATHVTG